MPATLFKKETLTLVFPVNFAKFLRTPFFYRTPPVAGSADLAVTFTKDSEYIYILSLKELKYAFGFLSDGAF